MPSLAKFALLTAALVPVVCGQLFNNAIPKQEVVAGERWSFVDCGSTSDIIQIDSLSISPDPPKPGADLTITASGTVLKTIDEGAYADVVVKLGLVKLLSKRFDVCEEARNANATLQCPVEPGSYDVVQTVALPKEIPPAKFTVQVRAYDNEDEPMMCADIKIDFLHRGFW